MVDIRGRVPNSGEYVFVVHYYQTKHPGLLLSFLLHTVFIDIRILQCNFKLCADLLCRI